MNLSPDIIERFYTIYQGDTTNLKKVAPALQTMGLGYMDILHLTMRELKLGLRDAIMLLEIPDMLV